MTVKGIDVSHWQGDIDWERIPDEYRFAFMKATEGTGFLDDKFRRNWNSAVPMLRGAYHFWRYGYNATAQAEHFFDTVDIVIRMRQMLQRTEELFGQKPIVYTARWWWDDWTLANTGFGDYDLWCAHYRPTWLKPYLPAGWDDWQVWQHSSSGKVPGVGGNCDLNVAKDEWFLRYETPEPPAGRTITLIVPKGDTVNVTYE